jgi:hypothetical protein
LCRHAIYLAHHSNARRILRAQVQGFCWS